MNTTNRPRASTIAAVIVAGIATGNAYLAMVAFGTDNLGMDTTTAYVTAGVFELSLVTVALLAREAAKDNRPGGVLLTLTWVLSGFSGVFAAIHEYDLGHGFGAVLFRVTVPLLAALMWHLALIGDRHLATGTTWVEIRRQHRTQRFYEDAEALFRANDSGKGIKRAQTRLIRSRHLARKANTPAGLVGALGALDASSAAETATLAAARENHARQMFAFAGATINQPSNQPSNQATGTPATITPTTPAPAPARPAPVAAPVFAQTIAPQPTAPQPTAATNQTTDTGSGRTCIVCGTELPANTKATVKYCQKNPDGTRNQKCKNRFYSPKFKAVRERVRLANAVDSMTTQQHTAFA